MSPLAEIAAVKYLVSPLVILVKSAVVTSPLNTPSSIKTTS